MNIPPEGRERVLRIVGLAGPVVSSSSIGMVGLYVKSFFAEAHGGRGNLVATADPEEALRFPDLAAALRFYQRVPINRPTRPDGEPNKPLTAFHIAVEPAPTRKDT